MAGTRKSNAKTKVKSAAAPDRGDFIGSRPAGRMRLTFLDHSELELVSDRITEDISALATIGRTLFCACDETATVERLVWDEAREGFEAGVELGHLAITFVMATADALRGTHRGRRLAPASSMPSSTSTSSAYSTARASRRPLGAIAARNRPCSRRLVQSANPLRSQYSTRTRSKRRVKNT